MGIKGSRIDNLKTLRKIYIGVAIVILNTIVLILLLNTFFHFANPTLRKVFVFSESSFNENILNDAYPHIESSEIRKEIIKENDKYSLPFVYDSFTGFRTKAHNGKFVNVDDAGFRYIKDQCTYPPKNTNFNVFVFGGSTTFGSGVIDNETIPSKIQEKLRSEYDRKDICVYNFARPHYYSTIERELFVKLIVEENYIPDIAIFIDGLNDHNGKKIPYEDKLAAYTEGKDKLGYVFSGTATSTVISHLYRRFINNSALENVETNESRIFERYISNQKVIRSVGNTYNVTTYFIIQPVPAYNYDCAYHLLCKRGLLDFKGTKWDKTRGFYSIVANSTQTRNDEIIWLGDIQKERKENFYVDYGHYTAKFSDEIANHIILRMAPINFSS
ncbi:MAG: hypothetical protein AABX10_02665 [Nanoarchaeota archaeon]